MWQNGLMEIERLTNNADIIAVATLVDDAVVPIVWRDRRLGPPPAVSWEIVLTSALIMYRRVRESVGHDGGYIRVIVGIHTVLVQREHGTSYAVVIETGHAIAKSLHRMIRKVARPASKERRWKAVDTARAIAGLPPLQREATTITGAGVDLWPGSGLPPLHSTRLKLRRDPSGYDPENPCPDPTRDSDEPEDDGFAESIDDMAITERPL